MSKYKYLLLLFILSSCSVSKELKTEREVWDYKNWKQKYKERAFCLCTLKGFENKRFEKDLIKHDKSYYNVLGIGIFDDSLDKILKNEVLKIRQDSINSIGKYPDDISSIHNKREVQNHCLEFYNSDRLEDLAKKQKIQWGKIENILDKIHEKIPTY